MTEYIDGWTLRQLRRVCYIPVSRYNPEVPVWIDKALEKAVSLVISRRYALLSELVHDLSHPSPAFTGNSAEPLIERNPLLVWKGLTLLLLVFKLLLLYLLAS